MERHKTMQTGDASRAGSVVMEYVIALGAIGVALLFVMGSGFYSPATGFGPLGRGVAAFWQRTLAGLALPVP